jgi:sugar lactone lactonase YvrE
MSKPGYRLNAILGITCALACGACAPSTQTPKWFVPQTFAAPNGAPELTVMGDLAEVLPNFRKSSTLEEFLYGPADTPPPLLRNAQGIVRVGDQLLVCDQGRPDVVAIDFQTGRVRSWIDDPARRPRCPVDITADESGNVYVSDTTLKVILAYGPGGQYLNQIAPGDVASSNDFRPGGVLAHKGTLYVGDLANHCVRRWSFDEGTWLTSMKPVDAVPKMIAPTGISVTHDDTLIVADAVAGTVFRLTLDGRPMAPLGRRGRGDGEFVRPKQACVTRGGLICVTDAGRQSISVFDHSGTFLIELHERANAWGGLTLPMGIASLGVCESLELNRNPNFSKYADTSDWLVVSDSLGAPSLVLIGVDDLVGSAVATGAANIGTRDATGDE